MIGDLVWLDVNGDGLQADDEPGVAGAVVVLRDPAGSEVARVLTDQFGAYEFAGVTPGSFFLELELPEGTGITLVDEGPDDEVDSDLFAVDDEDGTARTEVFTVPADHPDAFDLGLIAAADPPQEHVHDDAGHHHPGDHRTADHHAGDDRAGDGRADRAADDVDDGTRHHHTADDGSATTDNDHVAQYDDRRLTAAATPCRRRPRRHPASGRPSQ